VVCDALRVDLPSAFQETQQKGYVKWKSYPFDSAQVEFRTNLKAPELHLFKQGEEQSTLMRRWYRGFYEFELRCTVPNQNEEWEQHCSEWLESAFVTESEVVIKLREKVERFSSPQIKLQLAQELLLLGQLEDAEMIFAELWKRDDAVGFEARKGRIWIRALQPNLGHFVQDRNWLVDLALTTPSEAPLRQWAAVYLYANNESSACQLMELPCQDSEELAQLLEEAH
jgi:hypothetical protein